MKPPRIASRLLSARVMARTRRLAKVEEAARAEEAARLAEMARRDADAEAPPAPALTPLSSVACNSAERSASGRAVSPRFDGGAQAAPALSPEERVLAPAPTPAEHQAPHKRKLSAETRAKISQAARGRPVSPEARAKISQALRGQVLSVETRAKISQALRGHRVSAETRAKISQAGRGRPVSPEARAKISRALKGRKTPAETRAKISQTLRGHRVSAKTRAKIGQAARGRPVSAETRAKISRKISLAFRGEGSPSYWHGAYCMPAQPVKSMEDVIADLGAKQARISAMIDFCLESDEGLTSELLTLFSIHSGNAGKLGQLLRYQKSQSDPYRDELEKAINQALDEIAKETGLDL